MSIKRAFRRFACDEDGMATVEYALLLALVVVGTMTAWRALGTAIGDVLEQSADQISTGTN